MHLGHGATGCDQAVTEGGLGIELTLTSRDTTTKLGVRNEDGVHQPQRKLTSQSKGADGSRDGATK